jgi:hypothetical protein
MEDIILPRQDENGEYYISYSQLTSFTSESGFNTGLLGMYEYFQRYFLKEGWPDQGWALFGIHVEDYICYNGKSAEEIAKLDKECIENGQPTVTEALNAFTDEEKETLNKIEPLGNFQVKVKLYLYDNVYLLGYIDDAKDNFSTIRDYKTASKNSKKRYYTEDYKQLDLYSLWVREETGKLPETMEVKIIERKGNCFGMVERRDLLSVGKEIWTIERETSEERLFMLESWMKKQVIEVSNYYKTFLKLNGE